MNLLDSNFYKLNKDGFILKKNILQSNQIAKIKNIIKKQRAGKGVSESHYSVNIQSFIIKSIKFDFKKILRSFYFLNLQKKLKLQDIANIYFKQQSKLIEIDGYYNLPQQTDILPWHSDQAYSGKKTVSRIAPPDHFYLKFFFYLTDVGPNNGCTSYIPGSHKITYAVRSCLYEKKIKYEPFWKINDLVSLINKKNNYNYIVDKLESKNVLDDFLNKANLIISNKGKSFFDFYASSGDLLIFNEGGVHRGSIPTLNERVVLRYLYSKK